MPTIAELIVTSLADHGVRSVWGVVGDALNPVTDAIRREDRIEWIGVRHEEAGAFAVSAQAQLTGQLGVCMGTVGPGAIHLLNGLYDAAKAHAPVLAIVGQVPREDIGSDFFQEVDNDAVFADVAVFNRTVTSADQMPELLEQAVNAALSERGVAVLSIPGDVYEAADLDGASKLQQLTRITVPLVAGYFVINIVLGFKGFLNAYDIIKGLTDGGPGTSTRSVAMTIIAGFNGGDYAYQMANATIFFLVAILISLLQLSVTRGRNAL